MLLIQGRVDADAACQVGCEQAVRIKPAFDRQEFTAARIDSVELLGGQDLVLGEVNLAAAPDRRIDETVGCLAAGSLLVLFRVEFEVEAVAVLGK